MKLNRDRQVARVRLFETGLVFRLVDGKLEVPQDRRVRLGPVCPGAVVGATPHVGFFDAKNLYHGEGLDTDEKSLAMGLIFQGISSILIDEEVDAFGERVLIRLQEALGARLRGPRSSG